MTEARAFLRERLVEMQQTLVEGLAEQQHIDGGRLALLGSVGTALAAISDGPVEAEPMVRAIVTDAPGLPISLALYGRDGRAVAVELEPLRAIRLAGKLIAAALPRMS